MHPARTEEGARREASAAALCCGALLLGALAAALPATADQPLAAVGLTQLGRETWTREVGLAGNWVRDIVKGSDGFLWIATAGGLSRFDGRTFVNYTAVNEPELPSASVATLATGAGGRLWLGLEHGGVRVLEDGRLRAEPALAALPEAAVRTLLETADGALWIGTSAGLWRSGPAGLERLAPAAAAASTEIRRLLTAPSGEVWVRTVDRGLWRVRAGEVTSEPDAPGCFGRDLVLAPDGRLVTSCDEGIWERAAGAGDWTLVDPVRNSNRLLLARDGALWFENSRGLARRTERGTELLAPERGLGDPRVRAFLEDERGDLWVGTFSTGLSRLRRGAVSAIGAPEGLPAQGTTAVLGRADGSVWVGTPGQGAFLWSRANGIELHLTAARGLPSDEVWAIAEDPRVPGRVWLGTSKGLVEREGGRPRRVALAPGREEEQITLLLVDPADPETLWACAAAGGIHELRSGRFQALHDERNGLMAGRVRALGRERGGALLAGGDQGLFRYDGRRWQPLPLGGETPSVVRAWVEGQDGALWIASESSGLLRWKEGSLVQLDEKRGLPFAGVYSLELDRNAGLWLSGDDGVVRLRLRDFERWARGEIDSVPFELLSASDGLRDRECNGWGRPASSRLADDTLIYPTVRGIALIEPARVATAELLPHEIYVDSAWAGERELDLGRPLDLDPHERNLRLRFGAQEFLRPESVTFRYRLEGANTGWLTAARRTEAIYSHLKPGRYRFRVQARLPGQEWVEAAVSVPVAIAPTLVESGEFRLSVLVLVFAGVLAAFFWRTRVERAHAGAIAREREFLRQVIDTSPNPIFAKRSDFTYALANRAAAATFGLSPGELVGRTDAEVTRGFEGMGPILALDREVFESGEERVLPEASVVAATGEPRWLRVVKRPLRGASGAVEQVIGILVDVTDFKEAEGRLRARETELEASREELRRLAGQLIRAREEERRRLGREIHDDLIQRLVGLSLMTTGLRRSASGAGLDEVEAKLGEIGSELGRLASDAQALARDLHPSLLDNLGLEAALRAECETFGQRSGLAIRFDSQGVPDGLSPEASLVLYRIAQEAVRNAVTHSGAQQVRVKLEGGEQDLLLTVEDAGRGFSAADLARNEGIGLASIGERCRLIGAELSIDSRPGGGTRIAVRAPRPAVPVESDPARADGAPRVDPRRDPSRTPPE